MVKKRQPQDIPINPAVFNVLHMLSEASDLMLQLLALGQPPRLARPLETAKVTALLKRLLDALATAEKALGPCVKLWLDRQQGTATGQA